MSQESLSLEMSEVSNHMDSFLKDPKSDLLLISGDRIYPLHKNLLFESSYFRRIAESGNKVHILDNLYQVRFDLF